VSLIPYKFHIQVYLAYKQLYVNTTQIRCTKRKIQNMDYTEPNQLTSTNQSPQSPDYGRVTYTTASNYTKTIPLTTESHLTILVLKDIQRVWPHVSYDDIMSSLDALNIQLGSDTIMSLTRCIRYCTGLYRLTLDFAGLAVPTIVPQFTPLGTCQRLRYLELLHTNTIVLEGLQNCPQLTTLVIKYATKIGRISVLSECVRLTDLYLHSVYGHKANLTLPGMPSLRSLSISCMFNLESIPLLNECRLLEHLTIEDCPSLDDFSALKGCPELKHFTYGQLFYMDDTSSPCDHHVILFKIISSLTNCHLLESLTINFPECHCKTTKSKQSFAGKKNWLLTLGLLASLPSLMCITLKLCTCIAPPTDQYFNSRTMTSVINCVPNTPILSVNGINLRIYNAQVCT
jgi:hypothetical protein